MDMTGQQRIQASKEEVWAALNDTDVLNACIPGCQELIRSSETEMSAVAVIKVGPVKARFQGAVTLSDLDPPNGYKITGEGQGGVAGFAKGVATVHLEAVEDGTLLTYSVDAQIGGKLSQLGGRLIDVTAKQMSGQFFKRFAEEIRARQNPEEAVAADRAKPSTPQDAGSPAAASGNAASLGPPPIAYAPSSSVSMSAGLPTIAFVVFIAVVAAIWAVYGGLLPSLAPGGTVVDGRAHVSPDFASAVQLIMAVAIGYLFGTRAQRRD
jgi:carbon monoxide dehydrogenase subunit G